MNTFMRKTDRINRRMESSPIQRKLQKVSRNTDENNSNFSEKMRTPLQRRVRRVRSTGTASSRSDRSRSNGTISSRSDRKNGSSKEYSSKEISSLQRKLQRNNSSGESGNRSGSSGWSGNGTSNDSNSNSNSNSSSCKSDNNSNSSKSDSLGTTAQSVIELLNHLQSSPYAILKDDEASTIIKDRRKPPRRSYSEELFTPSRRHTRTGEHLPLRMMPKVKPSSMFDLYSEDGSSSRRGGRKSPKGLLRNGKKGEHRFRTDEFQSDSSPRSPRTPKSRINQNRRNLNHGDQTPKPVSNGDTNNRNQIKSIKDFIDIESSLSKYGNTRNQQGQGQPTDESMDSSFFQEAPSTLGDFHIIKSHRGNRPSKHQDATTKGGENLQKKTQNDKQNSSNGVVLHSSSNTSEKNREEDDKTRRRRARCSAGGKVRNHRTQEEYTGFFLTSPTEDNQKHGYGITKFPDGRLFEGVYERGRMVEGKMTYRATVGSSAPTYVGKFDEEGHRCGKGISTTATTTFLGQFRRDQQHGSGILIYHDGTNGNETAQSRRFIGHWKDGLRHGHGREILADGTIDQEGMWEAGRFVGDAVKQRRKV